MIFHSFLSKVRYCPLVMSLKDRRYKALNTAYLEHNSERAGFPRDFKLKGPDGFNLRLTYHDSPQFVCKRHRYFLKILRKNGSVTGVHSDHPSF